MNKFREIQFPLNSGKHKSSRYDSLKIDNIWSIENNTSTEIKIQTVKK